MPLESISTSVNRRNSPHSDPTNDFFETILFSKANGRNNHILIINTLNDSDDKCSQNTQQLFKRRDSFHFLKCSDNIDWIGRPIRYVTFRILCRNFMIFEALSKRNFRSFCVCVFFFDHQRKKSVSATAFATCGNRIVRDFGGFFLWLFLFCFWKKKPTRS